MNFKSISFNIIRIILYIIILIFAYMLFNIFFNSFYKVCNVSISFESEYTGERPIEIYYLLDKGDEYNSDNMVGITDENQHFTYNGSIELPCQYISGLRLDFGDRNEGTVIIKSVSIKDYDGYMDIPLSELAQYPMNDIYVSNLSEDSLELTVSSYNKQSDSYLADPYIEIKDLQKTPYKNYSNIFSAIAAVILTLIIYKFVRLKSVYTMFIDLYGSRKLIFSLAKNDFKTKYAGSYFGVLWAFVQPVCTILVFWFVFQVGFRSSNVGNVPYILWFICGLIPWFFFSEAWGSSTNSLQEYSFLVKKVVFNVNILPLVKIISALFVHIFFIIFLVIVFVAYGIAPSLYWLQALYYCICMIMIVIGLSYVTSALLVFFKDLGQIMNIVLQFGMWLTPIMWSIDIIPGNLMWLFKLNPMYYVVQGYRDSFIYNVPFYNNIKQTLYFWLVTGVIMLIGCLLFRKLKPHFADVL